MDFNEAQDLMENGKAVASKVSNTVYEMQENGVMLAEGMVIDEKFLSGKEIDGEWEEVRIVRTVEEYRELSDKEIEIILDNSFKKHQFDLKERKVKL